MQPIVTASSKPNTAKTAIAENIANTAKTDNTIKTGKKRKKSHI